MAGAAERDGIKERSRRSPAHLFRFGVHCSPITVHHSP